MGARTYTRARDGATVYCAVFFGPDGRKKVRRVRVVPEGATKKDHERALSEAEHKAHVDRAKVENGEWQDPKLVGPSKLSFKTLVVHFLRSYNSRTGRMDYYMQRSKLWAEHFGDKAADAVTPQDVDRFRKVREAEVSPTTVRQDLVALSTMFRWAKARRLVRENPADPDLVKRPPKSRPDPHPLSDGEVVALLDACTRAPAPKPGAEANPRRRKKPYAEGEVGYPWLCPIIALAVETGTDRSELVGLNWSRHVDQDRMLLRLPRAKTGVDRTLPYQGNATIRRLLGEAWKVRHPSGLVFLHDGEPVKLQAAKTAMRRVWKRAGIEKPRPWKSLRATFATRKAEAGVDVPTIAALMGLTTSHVLEHYIKPSGAHLVAAMAKADAATATGGSDGTPRSLVAGGSRPA